MMLMFVFMMDSFDVGTSCFNRQNYGWYVRYGLADLVTTGRWNRVVATSLTSIDHPYGLRGKLCRQV